MFGTYLRAGLIWLGAAVLDMFLNTFGTEVLAIADCDLPPGDTVLYCSYAQHTIDYFLLLVTASLLIMLLFRAWIENQAPGL